jgi:hypothetical protein
VGATGMEEKEEEEEEDDMAYSGVHLLEWKFQMVSKFIIYYQLPIQNNCPTYTISLIWAPAGRLKPGVRQPLDYKNRN